MSLDELVAVLRVDQMERWLRGERVPAEQYLHDFLVLGASAEHALDLVYAEYLLREQLGESPSLAEYAQRFPPFAEALRLQIDLHRALELSSEPRTVLTAPAGGTAPSGPVPLVPGYDVLGELGRGGMGVVYRAWQPRLKRLVALKMVRGTVPGEDERARFRSEYEILARLRHPNIVQIHEAGEADGVPYFSLELVEGGGLDRLLRDRPLSPREAAGLLRTLAEAVQYAHEQGVVHRDLKPANVLLASGGRLEARGGREPPEPAGSGGSRPPLASLIPKITDFGLAKLLRPDGDGQTLSGAVLGTPCYLSPEQAAGKGREVGPAADVYALGAILYECLTGRPPFQGATLLETLEQVRGREPLPPARLQPGVPRDLQTICLKCLQKEPHRRYASARALADDLGCWLDGRPVQARPAGVLERGLKWARRRPAVAALLAALAASLLGLLGLGVWSYVRIRAALGEAETARVEEERQKRDAIQSRDEAWRKEVLAHQAIDLFLTQFSRDVLVNRPGMEGLRRAFFKEAVAFYERLVRAGGDGNEVLAERGRAYMRYAQLTAKMAALPRALELGRKGQGLLAEVLRRDGGNARHRSDLAQAHVQVGDLLTEGNQFDAAETEYIKALNLLASLPPHYANSRASVHHNLGLLYQRSRRPADAERCFAEAVKVRREQVRTHGDKTEYKSALAMTLTELANHYSATGRTDEAEGPCRDALVLYRAVVAQKRGDSRARLDLGRGCLSLGILLNQRRRLPQAVEALSEAVDVCARLHGEFPGLLDYQHALAVAEMNRGNVLDDLGSKDRAEADYRAAARRYGELVRANPDFAEYALGHAATRANLALLLRDKGETGKAEGYLTDAIKTLEKLLLKESRYGPALDLLGKSYSNRAELRSRQERHTAALADYEQSLLGATGMVRSERLLMRALARANLGDHRRAAAEAAELARLPLPPPMLYNLACVRSLCGAAVLDDDKLPLLERLVLSAAHGDEALALLRRARSGGFFRVAANRKQLAEDADLHFLRLRKDFQELLRVVATQGR